MAWCHPVLYQRLMAARERRGTRIVTIDPRRTATAETADLHLGLTPGSDVTLWNGLLAWLADKDSLDQDWIGRHVNGLQETLEAARRAAPSLEFVAAATQLNVEDLRAFYQMFARTERVVTLYSQGVNQSASGTDKVNAILNCHLATGRIGRSGMGPFSLTGQPNAMGGREVGGLANQLAAHMRFVPEDIERVSRFWNAPRIATRPGFKALDLFEAVGDGRVKAVWIAATNPADSMPRAGSVREALSNCPLVITADAWPTDTTRLAHIVLPAAGWAEKDGTVTNSERRISRQRAFRPAPGKARPDWWMFAEVGRRMSWRDAFSYSGPADIFREHAALSAFENDGARIFNLGALADLDDAAYDNLPPVQWPLPKPGCGPSGARLFARGSFPTPDGRARMISLSPRANVEAVKFPLTLNTGRIRDQWHTMTRTGRVPRLMSHVSAPSLAMHPRDALARGITDNGLARIESAQNTVVMRVSLDDGLRPGDVFAPMHWTDQFSSSGPIGLLVHAKADPVSGQPDLKRTPVRVSALAEAWRGNLFRLASGNPEFTDSVWWAKTPTDAGFGFELVGISPLAGEIHSEAVLRRLLHIPAEAELVSYSDARKGTFRYAGIVQGRLTGCAFFDLPGPEFLGLELAKSLLGKEISALDRIALLAGLNTSGINNSGKTVCACFSVTEGRICDAILDHGLRSTVEIGRALKAGTNCGSCIPEIKKLIALHQLAPVA
jgi:assimilatory nitrate reductase catalytic subunit